jgi:hypothetical protein
MSSVHAVTEEIIFKARIASFYDFSEIGRSNLVKDFGIWMKQKGLEHEFLVWRVELIKEGDRK